MPARRPNEALKELNRKLRTLQYLLPRRSVEAMPQSVGFQDTLICNLRCPHCQTHGTDEAHRDSNDMRHDMPLDMVTRLAGEALPNADRYQLTLNGEPLASPHFDERLDVLGRHGARLDLTTNATLFTKARLARIIPAAATIQVSIDGATKPTVETLRRGANFEKLLHNIRLLTRTLELLPAHLRPLVSFSTVIMQSNVRELPELVRLASHLNVRRVYGNFLVVFSNGLAMEAMARHKALYNACREAALVEAEAQGVDLDVPPPFEGAHPSSDVELSRGSPESYLDPDAIERESAEIAKSILDEVQPLSSTRAEGAEERRLRDQLNMLVAEHGDWLRKLCREDGEEVAFCNYLYRNTYVHPSGDVTPCCEVGRPVLGQINTQTLREVWNGEAYRDFRTRFLSADPPACCVGCGHNRVIRKSVLAHEILDGLPHQERNSARHLIARLRALMQKLLPPRTWRRSV